LRTQTAQSQVEIGADKSGVHAFCHHMYGFAAIGNAIATRGRHVGWFLMLGVIALALVGI
jgi:hypothetical protein